MPMPAETDFADVVDDAFDNCEAWLMDHDDGIRLSGFPSKHKISFRRNTRRNFNFSSPPLLPVIEEIYSRLKLLWCLISHEHSQSQRSLDMKMSKDQENKEPNLKLFSRKLWTLIYRIALLLQRIPSYYSFQQIEHRVTVVCKERKTNAR
ncbi:uncharacterized protein LOC132625891 isoform X9 [Lycium barbarum]|nr:uncharacterized protein LOC132625891 isoform X9 [Lycium barbarum]